MVVAEQKGVEWDVRGGHGGTGSTRVSVVGPTVLWGMFEAFVELSVRCVRTDGGCVGSLLGPGSAQQR